MPIPGNTSSAGKKPATPVIGTPSAGNASASVPFTASTYVGKDIITYYATSNPGGVQGTATSTPISITGLSNGTSYTFVVNGITNYGVTSDTTSASSSVTPVAPPPPPPPIIATPPPPPPIISTPPPIISVPPPIISVPPPIIAVPPPIIAVPPPIISTPPPCTVYTCTSQNKVNGICSPTGCTGGTGSCCAH